MPHLLGPAVRKFCDVGTGPEFSDAPFSCDLEGAIGRSAAWPADGQHPFFLCTRAF